MGERICPWRGYEEGTQGPSTITVSLESVASKKNVGKPALEGAKKYTRRVGMHNVFAHLSSRHLHHQTLR